MLGLCKGPILGHVIRSLHRSGSFGAGGSSGSEFLAMPQRPGWGLPLKSATSRLVPELEDKDAQHHTTHYTTKTQTSRFDQDALASTQKQE